ncbi:MAG: xanthine dehydrogenase FAD-binding subunit XdhB, partial [Desulfobacterales bacterium]|nr:xanthine dehydrogenase FAD-binding subunit XdhB [Desulfobacterales bacterium]
QTEAAVRGLPADASLMEAVASKVLDDLSPRDSWRASKDFREHIIRELARRTLRQALSGAGGTIQ